MHSAITQTKSSRLCRADAEILAWTNDTHTQTAGLKDVGRESERIAM